jgi:5S rRNA maturation endonuclease (ribonuclease M5)
VGELMDVLREILLPKLDNVKMSGGSWMARCPAHDDGKASLHISRGTTHPVVLKCHAECDPADILAAVGLTWETLCAPRDLLPGRDEWTPFGNATAVYDYTDEAGKLLFQVLRTVSKQFPQRAPDASRKSGWVWKTEGVRRVLYRLPKVVEAVKAGHIIYVCEGEKDVHAIEAAGAIATCNPGGAGKWRPEHAEILRDAIVVIVADRDRPGQAHARQVYASLEGVARGAEIVEAAGEGTDGRQLKDAADHLGAGHTLAQLVVTKGAEEPAPDLAPDLHEFLGEVDPPYDWVIESILERGDRLIWTGAEGLGKTVIGRQLAVAAAAGIHPFNDTHAMPRRVLWIDCENSPRQGRRHFRKLERAAVAKGRRVPDGGMRLIHRPEGIDLTRDEDVAWFMERIHAHRPELLYIGPLYRLHATDINDETAARKVTAVLDMARVKADCALIIEGHSPHGDSSGGHRPVRPIGSSLFRRWPEFGYGISPANEDSPCKEVVVRAWRGARDERHWPRFLVWGEKDGQWPWVDPDLDPMYGFGYPVPDAS